MSHPYESFVHLVEKPARYLGGEYNSVEKSWDSVDCRFCLAFPDIYDIGMSHLGTKILYSLINKTSDLAMERCFTPWVDMERELRERELPLLSLENARPLSDFDVVGFSLQYEMTFTNVLTMLDLGGIPLRNADRTLDDPLVIAGGPTVTHPEPVAPFIDVFVVGDAEERLPRLLRHYTELKASGLSRLEVLAGLAREGGVYCPDLYERAVDPISGLVVVTGSSIEGVPDVVERAFVEDISRYRFPDDSPVPVAEAIFDRMAVEISRGCTEGCRFCQAGMIYRPVRERDPEQVVETVLSALDKGGYDEASISSLSTADYSCISPLIKTLMGRLRERKVSLGISSLRAYGLSEETLDEIATVKATGLTFAPEAGTQRMRDVINKNVTEDDIFETCHRVFSRGWKRMKLYFILGLPTETDEDIVGIAKMGRQARSIGLEYHHDVDVTVSVSSHVPKPHTPFQWAAMDEISEIRRKQHALKQMCQKWKLTFRKHNMKISHLEGIVTRGDIRTADLIEKAWNNGARFDGWDDQLAWDGWLEALGEWEQDEGIDRQLFLDTIAVDARLPWDHIDVGLEEGFLAKEYRKALKSRLSPPCGKPFRAKVHHTNVADALADERRLVCYDCGIACDMTRMREERVDFLEQLGAQEPPAPSTGGPTRTQTAVQRHKSGLSPHDFKQDERIRYRLRFAKIGPLSLQGHLDLVRILPRMFIRAGFEPHYKQGFSPRAVLSFGPALGLGARALGEYVDVGLNGHEVDPRELLVALNTVAPDGLAILGVRRLRGFDEPIQKVISKLDYAIVLPPGTERHTIEGALEEARAQPKLTVTVTRKKRPRPVEVWWIVESAGIVPLTELELGDDVPTGEWALKFTAKHADGGTLKPHEIAKALVGIEVGTRSVIRLDCRGPKPGMSPMEVRLRDAADAAEMSFSDAERVRVAGANARHAASVLVPGDVPDLAALALGSLAT